MKRIRTFLVGAILVATAMFAGHAVAQDCVDPPPGLVAWWPGDGNANDLQGNNLGTLENGATFGSGKVGGAFVFDGLDDFVDIANTAELDVTTGDFTIDMWVNHNSLLAVQTLFMKIIDRFPDSHTIAFESIHAGHPFGTTALRLIISAPPNTDPLNVNDLFVGVPILTGQWHHVAAVREGDTNRIYFDGSLVGQQTAGLNVDTGTGGLVRIGALQFSASELFRPVDGLIDEVEFFTRALSDSEILAIYDAGSAGKCKELPLVTGLIGDVLDLNLQEGITSSFDAKLNTALTVLDDLNENNDVAAINALEAFINAVDAQRENLISDSDADALIAAAQDIIALLSGP